MKIRELKKLLQEAVKKYVSQEESEYFADEVVETDLRKPPHKKYSEGIIADIKSWQNKSGTFQKLVDLPGFTQYNFNGLGPSLKIKEIHDELERKRR